MTKPKQLYPILQISEITPTLNNDKQQITTNDALHIQYTIVQKEKYFYPAKIGESSVVCS